MDFTELKRDTLARHLRRHIQGEVRFDTTSRRLYSTDASIWPARSASNETTTT